MNFTNNIFDNTKKLVAQEKHYTSLILKNLQLIERDKLYCDLGFSSLYKYLIKELSYGEGEAQLRVAAVKLLNRSPKIVAAATAGLDEGSLSLTHLGFLNNAITSHDKEHKDEKLSAEKIVTLLEDISDQSTRGAESFLNKELNLPKSKLKRGMMCERLLLKIEKLVDTYGERPEMEIFEILVDEKLMAVEQKNKSNVVEKNSRYIPVKVKAFVQKRSGHQCEFETKTGQRCDEKRNLQYEHTVPFAHGGNNSLTNIKFFCQNHNQREWMRLG